MLKIFQARGKKTEQKQEEINVREAFNLWDILKSKYDAIETLELWENMVHNFDLKHLINNYLNVYKENKKELENLLKEYSINGPAQGRPPSNWIGNTEPARDELIANEMLIYLQEHIENMLHASRASVTNDKIRNVFNKMLKKTIKETDLLYKYLKTKGWIETPPLYPNSPENIEERISCVEAAHLWDYLTYRYDNKRKTKLYNTMVKDPDFRIILQMGINILDSQTELLVKECQKFGITIPKRPAEVVTPPENTELFTDEEMYRDILIGLQAAALKQTKAFNECTFNDRIRKIFEKILLEEIDYYENFVKYGKTKGWTRPAPSYRI